MGNPPDSDRGAAAAVDTASPGQRLRAAREARKLTREAVAQQMRIETKVIDALERDDYTQLPAAVFVRGYLRAYAKLVGLTAEPLLASFDQRVAHSPPPLVLPTATGLDIESPSRYARWIVLALALLSLLLFYQWWHLQDSKPAHVAAVAPAPTPPPPAHIATRPPAPTSESSADTAAAVPTPAPGTPLENLYETPADESGLGEVTPPPAVAAPTQPSPAVATPAPADKPAPAPAAPPVVAAAAAPVAPTGDLVLHFTGDCWVVVRDADGRALLQGLIKSGARHVLDGKPPLQLTLGNAPAVEIEYRGQSFDQSRYTGASRIARFTLGK